VAKSSPRAEVQPRALTTPSAFTATSLRARDDDGAALRTAANGKITSCACGEHNAAGQPPDRALCYLCLLRRSEIHEYPYGLDWFLLDDATKAHYSAGIVAGLHRAQIDEAHDAGKAQPDTTGPAVVVLANGGGGKATMRRKPRSA